MPELSFLDGLPVLPAPFHSDRVSLHLRHESGLLLYNLNQPLRAVQHFQLLHLRRLYCQLPDLYILDYQPQHLFLVLDLQPRLLPVRRELLHLPNRLQPMHGRQFLLSVRHRLCLLGQSLCLRYPQQLLQQRHRMRTLLPLQLCHLHLSHRLLDMRDRILPQLLRGLPDTDMWRWAGRWQRRMR
jgi:hypothetical protein